MHQDSTSILLMEKEYKRGELALKECEVLVMERKAEMELMMLQIKEKKQILLAQKQ
jgi:hypothetical protein